MSTSKLMKVTYYDPKSQIRLLCYADTVVWDTKPTPTLTALRFGGYPERVQGLADAIYGGATIEIEDGKDTYSLKTLTRQYRRELSHDGVYAEATLLDPMSGSGTSQAAAQSLGVRSLLYDLNPAPACGIGGWDALRDEVDDSADLIFLHPPYHNLIPYSGNMWGTPHKDDLSRCSSYPEFVEKLNYIVQKLFMALRRDGRLAILVGDIRTKGSFYSMQHDLMRVGQMEAFIVKGQYNCVSDTRSYQNGWPKITSGPGATRVIWCSLHLTRTAPWQK